MKENVDLKEKIAALTEEFSQAVKKLSDEHDIELDVKILIQEKSKG